MCNYNFVLRIQSRHLTYMDFLSWDASLVSGRQWNLKSFSWQSSMAEHHCQPGQHALFFSAQHRNCEMLYSVRNCATDSRRNFTEQARQLLQLRKARRTLCIHCRWGRGRWGRILPAGWQTPFSGRGLWPSPSHHWVTTLLKLRSGYNPYLFFG